MRGGINTIEERENAEAYLCERNIPAAEREIHFEVSDGSNRMTEEQIRDLLSRLADKAADDEEWGVEPQLEYNQRLV